MKEFIEKLIGRLEINSFPLTFNFETEKYLKFDKTKEIVNQLAEEYNNGWIPCSERFPDKSDWYLAIFQEPETTFVLIPKVANYLMGNQTEYTTEDGWVIADCTDTETERDNYYKKLKCIAWQPLPAPYKPKGE